MAIIYSGAIARITLRADKYARIAFVATAATLGLGAVQAVNLAPGAAAGNLGATAAELRDRATHTGSQAISTVSGLQAALDAKIPATEKGANNGVAPLDSSGKIPNAQLPERLQAYAINSISDWNDATENGVYRSSSGTANAPENAEILGTVEAHTADWVTQTVCAFTTDGASDTRGWRREKNSGTWGSWYRVRQSQTELDARYGLVINLLAALSGGVDTANDLVSVWDASEGGERKVSVASLISSGVAGVSTFNGRSGAVTLSRDDVQGALTSSIRAVGNFPELQLGVGTHRARLIRGANEGAPGEVALQITNDGFSSSLVEALAVEVSGVIRAPQGLKYGRAIYLGDSVDLNTDFVSGFYDVSNPQNAPWPVSYAYLEVMRYSSVPTSYQKQTLTSLGDGAGESTYPVVWQRIKRAGTWGPWRPISGYVTPEDLGGSPAGTMNGASIDQTVAVARWIDYGLAHPTVPLVLNGFYRISAPINRSIGANNGFGIRSIGPASRAGFYMSGSTSRIYVEGADHDNPSGFNADQYQFSDFMIGIDADRTEPCLMMVAAPDTGSAAPGLSMRNVHQRRASDGAGVTGTVFLMVGIRYFDVQDVSGQGKYFQYQGNLFSLGDRPGGAPVEGCFTNIRMDHCGDMFRLAGSTGDVAYDDWQGMHFDRCTGLAVNKLVYMTTGPENPGFSEWVTISRCHAYYREAAVLSEKVGNLKVNDCYFLGHGNLPVIQGVGKSGASIVDAVNITSTTFKFDSTGATRLGINVPVSQKGKQWGNGFQNATGNNFGETENSSSTFVF